MPDEPTERDPLQLFTERLAALQAQLSEGEQANLVRSLSAWTDLLASPASQVTWMGTFQPGAQPAGTTAEIKIGTVPPPRARDQPPLADLLDALSDVFAALARMVGGPPGGPPGGPVDVEKIHG